MPFNTEYQPGRGEGTPNHKRENNQVRKDEDKNVLEQGFTLVELLIVVVILGILAGIVVFAVGNLTGSAASNACKTEGETFATAVQAYRAQNNGSLPAGATLAAVATTLSGADLLNSATLKYGGATPGWSYTVATGKVDTSGCP